MLFSFTLTMLPLVIQRQFCAWQWFVREVCETEKMFEAVLTGTISRMESTLLTGKVNLAVLGSDGTAPLHAACLFGDTYTVGLFVRHGVNLSLTTAAGATCLVG